NCSPRTRDNCKSTGVELSGWRRTRGCWGLGLSGGPGKISPSPGFVPASQLPASILSKCRPGVCRLAFPGRL
ncbi:unnamed protein product, partial [Gulo gulo]